jgi:hypothetical protein
MAGSRVSSKLLPARYFKSDLNEEINLLLIVRGRRESVRMNGITLQEGWYYWIDEQYNNLY